MNGCSPDDAHTVKGNRFVRSHCSQNDLEREAKKQMPYLMYAQVYSRLDIAYAVSIL